MEDEGGRKGEWGKEERGRKMENEGWIRKEDGEWRKKVTGWSMEVGERRTEA